jgi:predicted secreted protein
MLVTTGIVIAILILILFIFHGSGDRSVSNLYIIPAGTFSPFHDVTVPAQCQIAVAPDEMVIINETYNNSTICTFADGAFTLQLNENSRTGYQWQLTASDGLQVIDEGVSWYDEKGLPTRMPGIKGIHEWKIFVNESGVQKIFAILQRPERVTSNEQVFCLNVMVK